MAKFFFDTLVDDTLDFDTVGVDLPDVEAAKSEAKAALTDMARDTPPRGNHMALLMKVRDETGAEIYVASLTIDSSSLR